MIGSTSGIKKTGSSRQDIIDIFVNRTKENREQENRIKQGIFF